MDETHFVLFLFFSPVGFSEIDFRHDYSPPECMDFKLVVGWSGGLFWAESFALG